MRGVRQRVGPCVVLGTAPARDGAPAWAPDSASGRRLAELAGVPVAALGRYFALANLVGQPPATREELRFGAENTTFVPGWWYILAGTEVLRALGRRARPVRRVDAGELPWGMAGPLPLRWYENGGGVRMAVLPHPSGKNRWYNDARCKSAAETFLRAARWGGRGRAHDLWLRACERHYQEEVGEHG